MIGSPPIIVRDLVKAYPADRIGGPPVLALAGASLEVPQGAFYGLLGRNGEGKSTLMRCLLGLIRPSSGEALLLGRHFHDLPPVERARVAYVPQRDQLAGALTLAQYSAIYERMFPLWDGLYATALMSQFQLPVNRPIRALSAGMQRKAAIVLALAARVEVLLLDEPGVGLDPMARKEFIAELIDMMATSEGLTVLFSTHMLSDLEHLADHVGILHQGRMLLSKPVDLLREEYGRLQVICTTDHEAETLEISSALRTERMGRVINALVAQPEATRRALLAAAPEVDATLFPLSLEELFLELMRLEASTSVPYREVA